MWAKQGWQKGVKVTILIVRYGCSKASKGVGCIMSRLSSPVCQCCSNHEAVLLSGGDLPSPLSWLITNIICQAKFMQKIIDCAMIDTESPCNWMAAQLQGLLQVGQSWHYASYTFASFGTSIPYNQNCHFYTLLPTLFFAHIAFLKVWVGFQYSVYSAKLGAGSCNGIAHWQLCEVLCLTLSHIWSMCSQACIANQVLLKGNFC